MPNYMMANRFYCTVCRLTFFMPASEGYKKTTLRCPLCGERKAKYTSDNWWVEKNYKT